MACVKSKTRETCTLQVGVVGGDIARARTKRNEVECFQDRRECYWGRQ